MKISLNLVDIKRGERFRQITITHKNSICEYEVKKPISAIGLTIKAKEFFVDYWLSPVVWEVKKDGNKLTVKSVRL